MTGKDSQMSGENYIQPSEIEASWQQFLAAGEVASERRLRHLFGLLPADPRCKICKAPFRGVGSLIARTFFGKRPSKLNPRMCNFCEEFASRHQGGAEIELTMFFADVRGSTTLAELMSIHDFSQLINRFYKVATDVLIRTDALIDKLIGDEVTGMYLPGYAGKNHAGRAFEAALDLLRLTGHGAGEGPWVPVGIGIHTGVAFVGAVGSADGVTDITALGDAPNVAARLAAQAAVGEILISETSTAAARLKLERYKLRHLKLKGRNDPVNARAVSFRDYVAMPSAPGFGG